MRLTFEEPESGVTIVKLTQTDVPEEDRLVLEFKLVELVCSSCDFKS